MSDPTTTGAHASDLDVLLTGQEMRRALLLLFARPRPYSVVHLGGLGLLAAACRAHGLSDAALALRAAAGPLAAALSLDPATTGRPLDAAGLIEIGHALDAFRGRPPQVVSRAVRNEEMADAVGAAFAALGWEEFTPHLAAWSASGESATSGISLDEQGELDRAELMAALAARVLVYREAFDADPQAWQLAPVPVPPRTLPAASQLLGVSVDGRPFSASSLAQSSRYPNRVGRLMAAAAMAKLTPALKSTAPVDPLADALSVLAVVAESVSTSSPRESRMLTVRPESAAPAKAGWIPGVWWPVIDAWGSVSDRVRSTIPTAWRLRPVEADVIVWMLMWAMSAIGTVAGFPRHVVEEEHDSTPVLSWPEYASSSWDPVWGMAMASAWDVVQSVRPLSLRAPWPSPMGGRELSAVRWDDLATLPWAMQSGQTTEGS